MCGTERDGEGATAPTQCEQNTNKNQRKCAHFLNSCSDICKKHPFFAFMVKGGVFVRTNAIDCDSWAVLRRLLTPANALVVEVMLRTGMRVSDVLALEPEQIKPRFTVYESKTRKHRRVYIGTDLCERLRAQSGVFWVFTSPKNELRHRTRQAVWADIKRAAKAMRLDVVAAPHSARKSYAVDVYRRTRDIEAVRLLLQHDNLATTILYLLDEFDKPPEQRAAF